MARELFEKAGFLSNFPLSLSLLPAADVVEKTTEVSAAGTEEGWNDSVLGGLSTKETQPYIGGGWWGYDWW